MVHAAHDIAVIGLGTFGKSVARELTRVGDRVLGIDIDPARVSDLADEIDATLEADTSDPKALAQCGLDAFDAVVVSIGRVVDASLLTALNLQQAGHTNIWVKAQSNTHETLLRAIGIQNIIQPEASYGWRLAQLLHNPLVRDFLSLPDDRFIAQMNVPPHLLGRSLVGLKSRKKFSVKCVGIAREGDVLVNGCEEIEMQVGDSLLIYGSRLNLRRFADSL